MRITNFLLEDNSHDVYIIAEVGVNHNGSLELAKRCIDEAVSSGADAVKFQTFRSENLVTKYAEKAKYQSENTNSSENQLEMLKKLELSFEDFSILKQYCRDKGVDFLSTPFDEESADYLNSIEVDAFKIGSGDLNNIPFLKKIDRYGKPILLSTGMANLEEIGESLAVIKNSRVVLLHCTSNYPAPIDDVNLMAMKTMRRTFGKMTGYSDHTNGIEVAIAAVALGAKFIEKHFTVDCSLSGPDHKASLEPYPFSQMVNAIRNIERALGDGVKRCMSSEEDTKIAARKSIVMSCSKKAGDFIAAGDITMKRPGTGIEPKFYDDFIGKQLKNNVTEDQLLTWEDVI